MEYVYLILVVVCSSFQTVFNKQFSKKENGGVFTFTALTSFSALLLFLVQTKDFAVTWPVIGFAVLFALMSFMGDLFVVLAIKHGSLARTSLISSFSLLLPMLFGILFLNEEVKLLMLIGFVFLFLSLFLVNYSKSKEKISSLWILFVILAFLGNGMCSIVQRMEQICCEGERYSSIFMVIAFLLVSIFSLISALISEKKTKILATVRGSWHLAIGRGVLMGVVNMLVIKLNTMLPASILFPLISSSGLLITWLISYGIYRERFTNKQVVGYVFGLAAVVLLNV